MITLHKPFPFSGTYPLSRLGTLSDLLFFDIETTGFSGDSSQLYLIGCVFYENGKWQLTQWFSDTPESECEVLETFFAFLKKFTTVVHFNGDGFDIPYLQKRCRAHGLTCDFSNVKSIDIYKTIRPFRKLLGLESLKQKSIEQFLDVKREDRYSGGQLIDFYKEYLLTHETALFDLLILHNADDLRGMPSILPILSYPDFLKGGVVWDGYEITSGDDRFGTPRQSLKLFCQGNASLPAPCRLFGPMTQLEASGDRLTLTVEIYAGELKYFYPDYKNYYYLIYEDTAIHKSVAKYVDRDSRVKATARTCYTRRSGRYLPQFADLMAPALKREYHDKVSFFPLQDDFLRDEKSFALYAGHLFEELCGHVL